MNILICDDDKHTRKMLEKLVSKNPFINKIFTTNDGLEAVNITRKEDISIALMDIDMPNLDGIEAAKLINNMIEDIRFVFITGYMDYAIDSFCVHPYDYILKPVDIEHLKLVLNDIVSIRLKQIKSDKKDANNTFTIKQGKKIIVLNKKDILFFEKNDRDVLVNTANECFTLSNKSLAELENALDDNFFRSHRAFIVNKTKIKEIDSVGNLSYNIKFTKSKKTAILSKNKYEYIKEHLLEF